MSTAEEAQKHCEALVREHDKDRYLASLFAPAPHRRYLHALYAFDLETARVKQIVHEAMAGEIRLQWWHEALAGQRAEEAAASPVMIALLDASEKSGTNLAPLMAAVEGRQDELRGELPTSGAAAIFLVGSHFLGGEGRDIIDAAESAGKATVYAGREPDAARGAYRAFRTTLGKLPRKTLPAFLPLALLPLKLRRPDVSQWRKQLVLLRAAYFGFPKV
ncbi:MAG: squalene/phytoene synthase family protein [Pseudolabrys sp.]|nr:squalene/phytoene synthase family protein [Pseudolabrys sp.]